VLARGVVGTALANLSHLAGGVDTPPETAAPVEPGSFESATRVEPSSFETAARVEPGSFESAALVQPGEFETASDQPAAELPFSPITDQPPASIGESMFGVGPAEDLAERIEAAAALEDETTPASGDTASADDGPAPGDDSMALGLQTASPESPSPAPRKASPPAVSPAPPALGRPALQGPTHQVAPGETLSGIAAAYRIDLSTVLAANGLDPSAPILAGQQLFLPGGARSVALPAPATPAVRPAVVAPPPAIVAPPPLPRPVAPPPAPQPARPQTAIAAAPAPVLAAQIISPSSAPSALPGGPLIRPIVGPLTQRFTAGKHNGVDLAASTGTPIRAAAPGLVVVAARLPYGYGWRIMLDHGNGTTTLYAHLSRLDVAPGQRVTRGQVIGAVGATGQATGPHLHFEVALRGTVFDPLRYLP
jgi:murein DD-endopeptidase MepM/ murein hydrolase activator NlpD